MLKALPSVFVNYTAWMILPNRTASGELPPPRALRSNQPPLRKLRTWLTTPASLRSVPRTPVVGLFNQRPNHAAYAYQDPRIKILRLLSPGFPVLSTQQDSCSAAMSRKSTQQLGAMCTVRSVRALMVRCRSVMSS